MKLKILRDLENIICALKEQKCNVDQQNEINGISYHWEDLIIR